MVSGAKGTWPHNRKIRHSKAIEQQYTRKKRKYRLEETQCRFFKISKSEHTLRPFKGILTRKEFIK
jgi:hypothetical protein